MSVETNNKRKSLQINGTPNSKTKFKPQTPKSNQKPKNVNGQNSAKPNKKRSLSPSNASPAAKTPKLEKFAGTTNLNVSNNGSAKKQKQGNNATPSPGIKKEEKVQAARDRRSLSKTHFQEMIAKSTAGDLEARALVTEKIKELENVPTKSKAAQRKLRVLRKSIGESAAPAEQPAQKAPVTKKSPQKVKQEIKVEEEESSEEEEEEENKMEVDDDDESDDASDKVEVKSNDATLEDDSDLEESEDDPVEGEEEEDSDDDEEESDEEDVSGDEDDESDEESEDESNVVVSADTKKTNVKKLPEANKKEAVNKKKEFVTEEESKFIVYVGNIDFHATKEQITQHFEKAGKVIDINFVKSPGSPHEHNGNAFVQFENLESFEKSMTLHQTKLNDRRIIVLYCNNGARTPAIYGLINNFKPKPGFQNRQGGNFQNRQGGNFQNRQGGFQNRQGGNFQNKPGGNFQQNRPFPQKNFQNKQGGDFKGRPNNYFQNRQGNKTENAD